jgi:hypothetical protein
MYLQDRNAKAGFPSYHGTPRASQGLFVRTQEHPSTFCDLLAVYPCATSKQFPATKNIAFIETHNFF